MLQDLNPFAAFNGYIVIKELLVWHQSLTHTCWSGGYRSRTDDPLRARQVL
jgi:hypothetical protein